MNAYKITLNENPTNEELSRIAEGFGLDHEWQFNFNAAACEITDDCIKTYDPIKRSMLVRYCNGSPRDMAYFRKAVQAMADYVNSVSTSINLFISPERLFWAKMNELVTYGVFPKSMLKLFTTSYSGLKTMAVSINWFEEPCNGRSEAYKRIKMEA